MKTITQVAHELGVQPWRIKHALDAGYIDRPPLFSGRRIFDEDTISQFKTYFARREQDAITLDELFNE